MFPSLCSLPAFPFPRSLPEAVSGVCDPHDYYLPWPRTEAFKKSIAYALPSTWNKLQPEIKYQENAITFKWALKAHLLESIMEE